MYAWWIGVWAVSYVPFPGYGCSGTDGMCFGGMVWAFATFQAGLRCVDGFRRMDADCYSAGTTYHYMFISNISPPRGSYQRSLPYLNTFRTHLILSAEAIQAVAYPKSDSPLLYHTLPWIPPGLSFDAGIKLACGL